MGPELMAASAIASAAATAVTAVSSSNAQRAQAEADQEQAQTNALWSDRRAQDERAAAQRAAGEEARTGRLMQSKLGAVAGASGSGTSDPTVMNLFEGIEKQSDKNASDAVAAGESKAQGITYQASLDRWRADNNAKIKNQSANMTLLGGALGAAGPLGTGLSNSSMAAKYGMNWKPDVGTGYSKGWNTRYS